MAYRGGFLVAGLLLSSITAVSAQSNYQERPYASVRGWQVIVAMQGGRFDHCTAQRNNRGKSMRLGFNGRTWLLGIPSTSNRNLTVQVDIDGYGQQYNFRSSGTGWAVTSQVDIGQIRAGHSLSIGIGSYYTEYSLDGSSAAMLKVQECANNQGMRRATYAPSRPAYGYRPPPPAFGAPRPSYGQPRYRPPAPGYRAPRPSSGQPGYRPPRRGYAAPRPGFTPPRRGFTPPRQASRPESKCDRVMRIVKSRGYDRINADNCTGGRFTLHARDARSGRWFRLRVYSNTAKIYKKEPL